ncbi:MAG: hypothetical protein L6R43_14520, partial [Planctomycetes bacterium]|nr:hypothetical protein [Planctomycetota bacterium]
RTAPSDSNLGTLAVAGLIAIRVLLRMFPWGEPREFLPRLSWRLGVLFLLWWGVMMAAGLWLRFTGADDRRGRIIR